MRVKVILDSLGAESPYRGIMMGARSPLGWSAVSGVGDYDLNKNG